MIKIVCKSINRDTQVASKMISVNFSICIRRDDENVVGLHAPISYPVNRKREIDDRKSAFILSSGLVRGTKERCDQGGRSKEKKKDHFKMTQNPEFDTRSWPTVNANGMKSSSKISKYHFGGFEGRGVRNAIAAGKFEIPLLIYE